MAEGVSGFYPVDMDRNSVYKIQSYQKISGLYHADSLGYIVNTLKWDGGKFTIWQQWLAIYSMWLGGGGCGVPSPHTIPAQLTNGTRSLHNLRNNSDNLQE